LIRDEVAKSVEDEDAEEFDGEVVGPFRVEECVFFGGCFLCAIDVGSWDQYDKKISRTLNPPCCTLDSDDLSQSERCSVADFPICTVEGIKKI